MSFKVGDKVKTSAVYSYDGVHLASFVRTNTYTIIQIGGRNLPADRVVIGINGVVTAAVKMETLTLIGEVTPTVTPPVPPAEPEKKAELPPAINIDYSQYDIGSDTTFQKHQYTANGEGGVPHVSIGDQQAVNSGLATGSIKDSDTWRRSRNRDSIELIERKDPLLWQNSSRFPHIKHRPNQEFKTPSGRTISVPYYKYDYYTGNSFELTYGQRSLDLNMDTIRKACNIDVTSRGKLTDLYMKKYNRFKLENPNDRLSKTFAHVFFVRPDCNIYSGGELDENIAVQPGFVYAYKHCPEILKQLTQTSLENSPNHEFMMFLSNKAKSFEVSDEYIGVDTYGDSLSGYKIPYGKGAAESKGAGKFSIKYIDDRDLHVYQLTKLWMDYIALVYKGKINPAPNYNKNKILDYPTCVYYILCAEDGETVIFWSKYWGVFPIESPSSSFSFNIENVGGVKDPELSIQYQYAWKDDFDPLSLVEFNEHSCVGNRSFTYLPSFNPDTLGPGPTWVGAPFIEVIENHSGIKDIPYTFKLRFRPN